MVKSELTRRGFLGRVLAGAGALMAIPIIGKAGKGPPDAIGHKTVSIDERSCKFNLSCCNSRDSIPREDWERMNQENLSPEDFTQFCLAMKGLE